MTGHGSGGGSRVFISSVMRDYSERRAAAEQAVRSLGMEPILAEDLVASGGAPREVILNDVIPNCDALLGIYGSRYGWTGARSSHSPTEEEYDRARELFKPIYAFVDRIDNEDLEPRQRDFLQKVQNWDAGVLRREFTTTRELQNMVVEALSKRSLSPSYRGFLRLLIKESHNLNGSVFREEDQPFSPCFDLILHCPSSQFTGNVDAFIAVVSGDQYNRQQISLARQSWFSDVNRQIGAGFWKARGAYLQLLIVTEKNSFGLTKVDLEKDRRVGSSTNFEEVLVNLSTSSIDLAPGIPSWVHPLRDAIKRCMK